MFLGTRSLAALAALAACDALPDPDDGATRQGVVAALTVPASAAAATALGFDLNGDGLVDNALGDILGELSALGGGGFAVQETIDAELRAGAVLLLTEYTAASLEDDEAVRLAVFSGADADQDPANNLGGAGRFRARERQVDVVGAIDAGTLRSSAEALPIALPLTPGGDPVAFRLLGVRVEAAVAAADGRLAGKLGGAVARRDIDEQLIPVLAGDAAGIVARDCAGDAPPCGCADDSQGDLVVRIFDAEVPAECVGGEPATPRDCAVSAAEIRCNGYVRALLAPDVDLLGADGEPGADGVPESVSIGLGFATVPAEFDSPPR